MLKNTGTTKTRDFYDEIGWKEKDGHAVDYELFGPKENGPIWMELKRILLKEIRSALSSVGKPLRLLECGCGGHPSRNLVDLCSHYTGIDFSQTGTNLARSRFVDEQTPHEFQVADACALPFADGAFDAVYSMHMIYHIDDVSAQETAIAEMLRVVRSGGVVLLISANPYPFAFPMRAAIRLAAVTPILGSILGRFRSPPLLPYKPMPIAWIKHRLSRGGSVEVITAGMASTAVVQKVTEFNGIGKYLWKSMLWSTANYPRLSAYLGNYVLFICRKQ